jgi:hypothetical protein
VTPDPEQLLRDAEDEIEEWLCELDGTWKALLVDAEGRAERLLDDATLASEEVLRRARAEAGRIVADAESIAAQRLLEADADFERLQAIASEHIEAIRALTAADVIAARAVDDEQLGALRDAVQRLRTELSRVVDAAFDALPAMEATADAIDRVLIVDDGVIDLTDDAGREPGGELVGVGAGIGGGAPARPRLLRRLWRYLT